MTAHASTKSTRLAATKAKAAAGLGVSWSGKQWEVSEKRSLFSCYMYVINKKKVGNMKLTTRCLLHMNGGFAASVVQSID